MSPEAKIETILKNISKRIAQIQNDFIQGFHMMPSAKITQLLIGRTKGYQRLKNISSEPLAQIHKYFHMELFPMMPSTTIHKWFGSAEQNGYQPFK